MVEPIKYKKVLDSEGNFEAVELWQDNRYITITFTADATHKNGHRYSEIKEVLNKLQDKIIAEAIDNVGGLTP